MNITYFTLIICAFFGGLTSYFAKQRNRNPTTWFAIGFSLGLIGFLILFLLPSKQAQTAPTSTQTVNSDAAVPSDSSRSFEPPQKRIPTSSAISWYYLDENLEAKGPFTLDNLRKLLHQNSFNLATYIWCEEFDDWLQIQDCQNHTVLSDPDLII